MAALETDDDVGLLRQPIDNLALALVAPLRAYDYDIRHEKPRKAAARQLLCRPRVGRASFG
jgi:hypothetical protein